ncbi:MAG TPA: hypothetical protein VLX85_00520 [Stellaceae bacterium]|nr:hypothetical protein [Stellaceae bacterium]
MKLRERATQRRGGKTGVRPMAMASSAPKRSVAAKKSAKKPAKKPSLAKKAAKKPAPAAKSIAPAKPVPVAVAAAPRLATPLPAGPPTAAPKPPPRPPAAGAPAEVERRRAMTRRFFARLRSLEAIVGADLRKRGSVVLMQAVDQWYSEAASNTATEVSITTAAKAVIAQL